MRNVLKFSIGLYAAGFGADLSLAQSEAAASRDAAVVISMEGETHQLHNINWSESTVTLEAGEIRFYLVEDENPVTLNFNLSSTDVLEAGVAVYTLPEANAGSATIDLNFFNRNRASSRMQRRILFDEGTIEIQALTRNTLRMTFSGSGHPLMDQSRVPIEGSVNISF